MKKKTKIILILLLSSSINIFSQNYKNLGINLDQANAFVNIMNNTNRYAKAAGYDSLGWATSDFELVLNDGRPVAEWNNDIDDPEIHRINYSGTYKSSFFGSSDITISGSNATLQNKQYDPTINLTTFEIFVPFSLIANQGFLFMTFKNTKRTNLSAINTGITKLKIMKPGYGLNTNKIFTDEYISLLKTADFACYRFYGLQDVWNAEPVYPALSKWNNRKKPDDASQISMKDLNGKLDAWCWEYIIELANILKKDIWINIYISSDSEYVANLANMLKSQLDPSINIYVENSNEVWSPTQAPFGTYNKAQADYYKISFDQNYARRCVELSNWFSNVYGKGEINKIIRIVLGAQQYYGGRSDTHLNYINSAFGAPNKYIYALSPSLYFGSNNPNGDTTAINQGMMYDINSQITDNKNGAYRNGHLERAKKWNLTGGCVSYEGGPGLPSGGGKTNLGIQIQSNRTYKMKEIIKKNYADGWFDIGGNLAMYFTLYSSYNRYGCWGLTDDYNDPDRNYKMQAIRELIGTSTEVNAGNNFILNSDIIQIFPNPINDKFNLIFNSRYDAEIKIQIFDQLGNIILNMEKAKCSIGLNSYNIELNNITSGIYFLKAGNKFCKLVKL